MGRNESYTTPISITGGYRTVVYDRDSFEVKGSGVGSTKEESAEKAGRDARNNR